MTFKCIKFHENDKKMREMAFEYHEPKNKNLGQNSDLLGAKI